MDEGFKEEKKPVLAVISTFSFFLWIYDIHTFGVGDSFQICKRYPQKLAIVKASRHPQFSKILNFVAQSKIYLLLSFFCFKDVVQVCYFDYR